SEEQRSQRGCPARQLCYESRGRDTRLTCTRTFNRGGHGGHGGQILSVSGLNLRVLPPSLKLWRAAAAFGEGGCVLRGSVSRSMRILSITAGAAGIYCGSCSRDNA